MAYQEITKQQNIEAVTDNAYEELENVDNVSSEPVNSDWMFRFFNSVENISNEDMQKIWGHILAGEIKCPNTYSFRTLEKLKNMTQQEVKNFQLISSLALQKSRKKFVISEKNILKSYGVDFSHILELEECGLMTAQSLVLTMAASASKPDYIYNSDLLALIYGKEDQIQTLQLTVYFFTESGSQLITAINPKVNSQYFSDCLKSLQDNYKDFVITAHNINSISNDGKINYNRENILS